MKNAHYLILLLVISDLFFDVMSKSIPINIFQEIGKGSGPASCNTVKFLLDSNFTQSCALETFPANIITLEDSKNQTILCLALYDFSLKWCLKSSQNIKLPQIANATEFDSEVSKFASVGSVEKFCESEKHSGNASLETEVDNLYKHSSKCILYCWDSSEGTYKPKKICSALSWLEHILETHNEVRSVFATSEKIHEVQEKTAGKSPAPVVQSTGEQNAEAKTPGVNTTVVENKVEPISNKKTEPESVKISSARSNDKSIPVVVPKESKKFQLSQANTGTKSDNVKNSTVTSNNQEKEIVSGVDSSSLSGNIDKQKVEPSAPKKEEVLSGVENTELKPPQAEIPQIDQKPESADGKAAKGQKSSEIKPITLSANTDEFNDNLGDDPELQAPPAENEDSPADDAGFLNENQDLSARKEVQHYHSRTTEEESHFFSYFVVFSLLFVCFYIAYHNKKKILAMFLEGRRSRNGRGRRRPSTANYRKLDCNLEEAVTSQCNTNVTHVIY